MRKERSWTDDQLRNAVLSSTSLRAVVRALGLSNGSAGYVARCIAEAAITTEHFTSKVLTPPRAADESLREVVPKCSSWTEVLRALGLELHSNNFNRLRKRVTLLGIDTSHFTRTLSKSKTRPLRWTDEQLRSAVAGSLSVAQTLRALGLVPAGGNYDQVQRRMRELEVDTSHFVGRGWNKGKRFMPFYSPLESILVAGRWTSSHSLKKRLFKAGLKRPACELCGWCQQAPDGRIPVELDHINGDRNDNRIENLRILCPNCHSLQSTHRGLNQKRRNKELKSASGGT